MKLLDTQLKEIKIEEISEEIGEVEVYNFEVQDNHNYFAGHVSQDASASFSGVLVHNDYKPNEAQAFNDKAKELQTATLIQPVIDKVINEQPIQGSNTAYSYPFDNTLNDLIQLTNNNSSLNAFQKIEFANQFQVILTKYNQNIINYNKANNQANKIVIQIQLLQGKKALDSGFVAQEANKNLKAAEITIKQIKEQINDPLLEKSLDNITNKVFWTQIELGAWGGIREVAKVFVDKNNIDNALRNQINEIIKLNALSSPEALELFGSQDIRNILSKNTINQSELKELQTFEIDKRKDLSSASTTNEALTKQIIIDSKDSNKHPQEEIKSRIKEFIDSEKQIKTNLENKMAFLLQNKDYLPEKVYYAEIDHIAYEAANQIIDSSRIDDFVGPLDQGLNNQNSILRNELANVYIKSSQEGIKHVNEMNKLLYPSLDLPDIPEGMTYFGNMLSPSPADKWVRSPYQVDPPRFHPTKHITKKHTGMDFSSPLDTPIRSTVKGNVISILLDPAGYGYYINVNEEGTNKIIRVAHIDNPGDVKVSQGQKVDIGTELGLSGKNGPPGIGPHLHYEVLESQEKDKPKQIDPRLGKLKGDRS
jgi:murein DD-endopeptidase MepM/ murein hydrolase activator NlpD